MKALEVYKGVEVDKHARYKSWEHCYKFFTEKRRKQISLEQFSLHLFAYLGSWGMLRGSSFLLQKDYLFHVDVVKEILDSKYDCLHELDPSKIDEETLNLLFSLKHQIKEIYFNTTSILDGVFGKGKYASDTLITKILLGTLGCVPAYDRYFVNGIKQDGFKNLSFNRKSLIEIKDFYKKNRLQILNAQSEINNRSTVRYPIMKIIDMHFWRTGYENKHKS